MSTTLNPQFTSNLNNPEPPMKLDFYAILQPETVAKALPEQEPIESTKHLSKSRILTIGARNPMSCLSDLIPFFEVYPQAFSPHPLGSSAQHKNPNKGLIFSNRKEKRFGPSKPGQRGEGFDERMTRTRAEPKPSASQLDQLFEKNLKAGDSKKGAQNYEKTKAIKDFALNIGSGLFTPKEDPEQGTLDFWASSVNLTKNLPSNNNPVYIPANEPVQKPAKNVISNLTSPVVTPQEIDCFYKNFNDSPPPKKISALEEKFLKEIESAKKPKKEEKPPATKNPFQDIFAGSSPYNKIMMFNIFHSLFNLDQSMQVWFYKDPMGNVQGAFSSLEMDLWNLDGYFKPKLEISWLQNKSFITIEAFKDDPSFLYKMAMKYFPKKIKFADPISNVLEEESPIFGDHIKKNFKSAVASNKTSSISNIPKKEKPIPQMLGLPSGVYISKEPAHKINSNSSSSQRIETVTPKSNSSAKKPDPKDIEEIKKLYGIVKKKSDEENEEISLNDRFVKATFKAKDSF